MRILFVAFVFLFLLSTSARAQTNSCKVGDANNDGLVNIADFAVWRKIFLAGSPTTNPTNPPTVQPTISPDSINIQTYGATANDTTDDTSAIQNALNAATAGKVVVVPPGTFIQTDILTVPAGVTLRSESPRTGIINAPNVERQSIVLKDNAKLINLKLTSPATVRGSIFEHHRIVLNDADGVLVQGNHIDGGTAAGIYIYSATNYQILDNLIENTLADGIHNTAGSSNGLVKGNTLNKVGDDGVAVVSYVQDGDYTHDITITNNIMTDGIGRGITVVGGKNVLIENNTITHTRAAGLYFASEDSYNTYAAKDVTAKNNIIDRANYEVPLEHAGIFAYARAGTAVAGGQPVTLQNERLRITGNTVKDTMSKNWHVAFIDMYSKDVYLANTTITGAVNKTPVNMTPPATQYFMENNTFNGELLPNGGTATFR